MSDQHSTWLAARTAHLPGGLRAFNGLEPTVHIFPVVQGQPEPSFQARQYGSLYADLASLNLLPIGFEFMSNSLDAKGLVPPGWRSYHPWGRGNIWPCEDQIQEWSQIGWVASKQGNAVLWDIARRIAHQLRVTAWRLYQLSDAYFEQLRARAADPEFSAGVRFENGFTWLGYLAAQSFLVDACILRDYLAEFFVAYVVPQGNRPNVHITTMAKTKKLVLDKVKSADPLFDELLQATSKDGWLFLLGAYRDMCVHCVPLARSESRLYAVGTSLPLAGARPLTGVSLPLPSDPSAISAARASADRGSRLAEELELMTSATRGQISSTDTLIYCYSALDRLTQLTVKLRHYSPVEPEIPHITPGDGEIKIRRI